MAMQSQHVGKQIKNSFDTPIVVFSFEWFAVRGQGRVVGVDLNIFDYPFVLALILMIKDSKLKFVCSKASFF